MSASLQLPLPVSRSGRDVGRPDIEGRLVEAQSPRQCLVELKTVRPPRGVAVVASHDGVDEIAPALERRLRHGGCASSKHSQASNNRATIHFLASRVRPPSPQKKAAQSAPPPLHPALSFHHAASIVTRAPALRPRLRPSLAPVRNPALSPRRRGRRTR